MKIYSVKCGNLIKVVDALNVCVAINIFVTSNMHNNILLHGMQQFK